MLVPINGPHTGVEKWETTGGRPAAETGADWQKQQSDPEAWRRRSGEEWETGNYDKCHHF